MLQVFNTMTRKKEVFKPLQEGKVLFYHCGPTVYWIQHIGNLRAAVLNDFIVRTLEYLGYRVTLVRNYTDVGHLSGDNEGDADTGEDRMEKAAKREQLDPQKIAQKYINVFANDLHDLNVRMPDITPRATEHIQEMQAMIQTLLDKGYAYITELAIYFDVSKAKQYTKLSGQKLEKNIKNAGSGEISDPNKKHPADFVLWFFKTGTHAHALQTWPSPWGTPGHPTEQGFPGWHIECSAMSRKYLGDTLDIHMGGIEHVPVHHTNEIAQSESVSGKKFVNYWLHNEHLTVDGKKMAKSEGTAYSLAEIKEKGYDPLALRYFYLGAHYRSKQNFSWQALDAAASALEKLRHEVSEIKTDTTADLPLPKKFHERFAKAIADDFNTPQALAVLWDVLKDDTLTNEEKYALILDFDRIFGLKLADVKAQTLEIPASIQALLDNRAKFRELGDFEQADAIRQEIEAQGFSIKDTPQGVKVRKK